MPEGVFAGLSSLVHLVVFSNDKLSALPKNAFSGLTNLEYLGVYGNDELKTMPQDVFSGLTNLNGLSLFGNDQLSTLPAGVFSGLPRLGSLMLFDCGFVRLPEGLFTGLYRVGTLWLHGNPGSPFTLTVELVRKDNKDRTAPGPARVVIKVVEGAPREMTVSLSARGGTLSADKATIAVGATESETVVVTQTEGGPVIVIPGSASALPTRFLGLKTAVGDSLVLFR